MALEYECPSCGCIRVHELYEGLDASWRVLQCLLCGWIGEFADFVIRVAG